MKPVGMLPGASETAWLVLFIITSAAPGYSPTRRVKSEYKEEIKDTRNIHWRYQSNLSAKSWIANSDGYSFKRCPFSMQDMTFYLLKGHL